MVNKNKTIRVCRNPYCQAQFEDDRTTTCTVCGWATKREKKVVTKKARPVPDADDTMIDMPVEPDEDE